MIRGWGRGGKGRKGGECEGVCERGWRGWSGVMVGMGGMVGEGW